MSIHKAEVIKIIHKEPHPNADSLEIIRVQDYPCCARIGDFKVGDLAVFIEPDSLVPVDRPEFAFLAGKAKDGYARIRAAKLRGTLSYGLLIKVQEGMQLGDNVMDTLGIKHYEPVSQQGSEPAASAPNLYCPKYDMENYRAYPDVLKPGERVVITEKLNGESSRYVFHDGKLHVSSHNVWKIYSEKNQWWQMAEKYDLATKLAKYPDYIFFGENYGKVKHFRYGHTNDRSLAFFDVLYNGEWLPPLGVRVHIRHLELPSVPVLYAGAWKEDLVSMAEGRSLVPGADNIREGIVITPMTPRVDDRIGRVILKVVSGEYLAGKY